MRLTVNKSIEELLLSNGYTLTNEDRKSNVTSSIYPSKEEFVNAVSWTGFDFEDDVSDGYCIFASINYNEKKVYGIKVVQFSNAHAENLSGYDSELCLDDIGLTSDGVRFFNYEKTTIKEKIECVIDFLNVHIDINGLKSQKSGGKK